MYGMKLLSKNNAKHLITSSICTLQVMNEIAQNNITLYDFPLSDNEEEIRMLKKLKVSYLLFFVT